MVCFHAILLHIVKTLLSTSTRFRTSMKSVKRVGSGFGLGATMSIKHLGVRQEQEMQEVTIRGGATGQASISINGLNFYFLLDVTW